MRLIILILFIAGTSGFVHTTCAQSKTIAKWTENKPGMQTFCFYPTTLRMVNVKKDTLFNQITRDIKKLKLVMVDITKTPFPKSELSKMKLGIKAESYQDMLQIQQGKDFFYLFVKEKNAKPVGIAGIISSDQQLILVDLKGYISPATIQQLISGKLNLGPLTKIMDMTGAGKDKKDQQKKNNKPDRDGKDS